MHFTASTIFSSIIWNSPPQISDHCDTESSFSVHTGMVGKLILHKVNDMQGDRSITERLCRASHAIILHFTFCLSKLLTKTFDIPFTASCRCMYEPLLKMPWKSIHPWRSGLETRVYLLRSQQIISGLMATCILLLWQAASTRIQHQWRRPLRLPKHDGSPHHALLILLPGRIRPRTRAAHHLTLLRCRDSRDICHLFRPLWVGTLHFTKCIGSSDDPRQPRYWTLPSKVDGLFSILRVHWSSSCRC